MIPTYNNVGKAQILHSDTKKNIHKSSGCFLVLSRDAYSLFAMFAPQTYALKRKFAPQTYSATTSRLSSALISL